MSRYVEKTKRWPLPTLRLQALDIELTERCNNNCIHCCINRAEDDREAKGREMTTGRIKRHLDEAARLGCLRVRFTGGEPLLRGDFEEIYLHARRLGLKVLLFTNARLVSPALADLFARVPLLAEIEVSVYGMTAESYDTVARVPGAFAGFRRGLDLLRRRDVPFVLKWIPLPPNVTEFDLFSAWAEQIPSMTKRPKTPKIILQLRDRRDDDDKNVAIDRLRQACLDRPARLNLDTVENRREIAEFCGKFLGPPGDRLFNCGAGNIPTLDAYGHLQPCLGIRAPELCCDLENGSLSEALSEVFPRLHDVKAYNPEYLRRCARCFLKSLCEQCPARSWAEHGTLDQPVEYLCALAHEQARGLGLLGAEEQSWEVADWAERIARMNTASGQSHFQNPGNDIYYSYKERSWLRKDGKCRN